MTAIWIRSDPPPLPASRLAFRSGRNAASCKFSGDVRRRSRVTGGWIPKRLGAAVTPYYDKVRPWWPPLIHAPLAPPEQKSIGGLLLHDRPAPTRTPGDPIPREA